MADSCGNRTPQIGHIEGDPNEPEKGGAGGVVWSWYWRSICQLVDGSDFTQGRRFIKIFMHLWQDRGLFWFFNFVVSAALLPSSFFLPPGSLWLCSIPSPKSPHSQSAEPVPNPSDVSNRHGLCLSTPPSFAAVYIFNYVVAILTDPDHVPPPFVPDSEDSSAPIQEITRKDDLCVETEEGLKHCRLIAIHAGLVKGEGVEEQLQHLKSKDTRIPKVETLSGRKSVWDIPEELKEKPTLIVSGHHGKLHIDGLRLIIDEGVGYAHRLVAAIILPSMKLVKDTDCFK